jgi:hypothetical protein
MNTLVPLLACPDCPTNIAARAWVMPDFWPNLGLLALPMLATAGVIALIYWQLKGVP